MPHMINTWTAHAAAAMQAEERRDIRSALWLWSRAAMEPTADDALGQYAMARYLDLYYAANNILRHRN